MFPFPFTDMTKKARKGRTTVTADKLFKEMKSINQQNGVNPISELLTLVFFKSLQFLLGNEIIYFLANRGRTCTLVNIFFPVLRCDKQC